MAEVIKSVSENGKASGRVGILVMGMHRSGTSALTRVLNLFGCDLPKTLMESRVGNETGHWESQPIMSFNDALLASAGTQWDDWLPFNSRWYDSPVYAEYLSRGRSVLREELGDSPLFVVKDPRICRIGRYWLDLLVAENMSPRVVIPIRNPLEVARSLKARDGMHPAYAQLLWLRHVLDAELATRDMKRVFVSYEQLIGSWQVLIARLQEQLDIALPRLSVQSDAEVGNFLSANFRHHVVESKVVIEDPTLSTWLRATFSIVTRWGEGRETQADRDELDCIRDQFEQASPAFGQLLLSARDDHRTLRESLEKLKFYETSESEYRQANYALKAENEVFGVSLREQQESCERLKAELDAARNDLVFFRKVTDESKSLADSLNDELEQRRGELENAQRDIRSGEALRAAVEDQLNVVLASLAAANEAVDDQKDRMFDLENMLRQREEEISQAWVAVTELKAEREVLQNDLLQGRSVCVEAERRLSERDAELAVLLETLRELEINAERLARERGEAAAQAQRLREELHGANTELKAARRQSDQDAIEYSKLKSRISSLENDLVIATRGRDEAKARLARMEEDLRVQEALQNKTDARLRARFEEIATLGKLLYEQERARAFQSQQTEWIRSVAKVLMASPRWWMIMPDAWRRKKEYARLARRGLFDADAYVANNPDVAAAKADPLRHYINHGMGEGRAL